MSAGAQAEFDAEQDYMKTLSYLSQEEQDRYKARQSVSFLYTKPPGFSELAEKIKVSSPEFDSQFFLLFPSPIFLYSFAFLVWQNF